MSARDAESGSSTYKGGSRSAGGLGNGGIGGGMGGGGNWGGGMGGGAGRNGGIGNRTGLTTGNRMYGVAGRNGVTFSGRPGGFAQQPGAFGIRPQPAIGTGPLSGVRRPGAAAVPAAVPGVNPVPEYVPQYPAYNAEMALPEYPPVQEIDIPFPDFAPPSPYKPPAISGPWLGQSVSPLARNPNELSNYNWSGKPANIQTVSGGQGVQAWDRYNNTAPSSPSQSSRGWGGWNTPWN